MQYIVGYVYCGYCLGGVVVDFVEVFWCVVQEVGYWLEYFVVDGGVVGGVEGVVDCVVVLYCVDQLY